MSILCGLLALIGTLATVFNLSLVNRRRVILALSLLTGVIVFAMHPWTVQINFYRVFELLTAYGFAATISVYLICEGLGVIVACHTLSTRHNGDVATQPEPWPGERLAAWIGRYVRGVLSVVVLLPTVLFIITLAVSQAWLFHNVSGVSYTLVALMQAVGVAAVLPIACWAFRWALPLLHWRIELRILLAMLQVGLAMFLPVLAGNTQTYSDPFPIDPVQVAVVLLSLFGIATVGFAAQRVRANLSGARN